jgi:hypothetical protein
MVALTQFSTHLGIGFPQHKQIVSRCRLDACGQNVVATALTRRP